MNVKLKWMSVLFLSFGLIYPTLTQATIYCVVARNPSGNGTVRWVPQMNVFYTTIPAHYSCTADDNQYIYFSQCYDGGSGSKDQDNRDSTAKSWMDQGKAIYRCSAPSNRALGSIQQAAKGSSGSWGNACDPLINTTSECTEGWVSSTSQYNKTACVFGTKF